MSIISLSIVIFLFIKTVCITVVHTTHIVHSIRSQFHACIPTLCMHMQTAKQSEIEKIVIALEDIIINGDIKIKLITVTFLIKT